MLRRTRMLVRQVSVPRILRTTSSLLVAEAVRTILLQRDLLRRVLPTLVLQTRKELPAEVDQTSSLLLQRDSSMARRT